MVFYLVWSIRRLFKDFHIALSFLNHVAGSCIKVRTELSKSRQFAELCLVKLKGTCYLLHRLDLSGTSHTRYRDTHVNRWTYPRVEQVRFEEYLSVGDRNHVGWDISGNVTSLGFYHRKCGKRTTTLYKVFDRIREVIHIAGYIVVLNHLSSAFQEARVQVEHVPRVGFTSRRATKQEGYLTVSHRLLGKVIIDNKCWATCITEVFPYGYPCKRSIYLHWCWVRSIGRYDSSIGKCSCIFQGFSDPCYSRGFLTNGYIDTIHWITCIVELFLVEDGIDTYGSFTCLSVPDYKLTLTAPNRNHSINSLNPCLQRFIYGLAIDYPWRLTLERHFVKFA